MPKRPSRRANPSLDGQLSNTADPVIEILADIHSTELYVALLQVSLAALGQLDELMKDNEKVTILTLLLCDHLCFTLLALSRWNCWVLQ